MEGGDVIQLDAALLTRVKRGGNIYWNMRIYAYTPKGRTYARLN